jgi:hypothetical protein
VLQEPVWVVDDDLPRREWPTGAIVYTRAEVARLKQVGQDALPRVHLVKAMFAARVVAGRRRGDARDGLDELGLDQIDDL